MIEEKKSIWFEVDPKDIIITFGSSKQINPGKNFRILVLVFKDTSLNEIRK